MLDLESGAVVYVGPGKGGDALTGFWTRLRRSGAKIEAVATDMSPAYIEAVTAHLPGTRLVFDRFHVIKLYNDKLSELRRALYHQFKDTMQKDVLKGVRWLLLMDWILYAEATGIAMLQKFAKTLRLHVMGILAYYDHPISTGRLV